MGGQKFQYDESGGTFFYFLLSFLVLILLPATFYYWPRKKKQDLEQESKDCQCSLCKKERLIKKIRAMARPKNFLIKLVIVLGWVLLILLAYKVSQFDYEMANFDPYEILGVQVGSSQAEIKKAYRKLSVILHPDKETGNEKEFMKLTKAYQALTDEEARRNWEKYGNPDGPGAMSFGIALPSWIVEKENSVWVLGLYALVFMVALPIIVGTWWYRSIRFSGDQVLLDTTHMYYYFFHKTPHMMLKRVIMILAASLEFDRKLIKTIGNLNEKNKERPLCFLYSIKARALLHAHLSRIPLNPLTLEQDRRYIVGKCPYLIQEQVNCVFQLILLAYAGRIQRCPKIDTIENCMKLCPMIVQGLWDLKSPFLQLPHIHEGNLKYFMSKKRQIKSLQQFAQLKGDERRSILSGLTDDEYLNVMKVLGRMPYLDFQVKWEVMDDENPTEVTTGAIVTVTVTLIRRDMSTLFGDETIEDKNIVHENNVDGDVKDGSDAEPEQQSVKRPVWQKQRKTAGKKSNKKVKQKVPVKHKTEEISAPAKVKTVKEEKPKEDDSDLSDSSVSDINESNDASDDEVKNSSVEDEDQEWEKLQQKLHKREKVLEGRSKLSHTVHCPLYPYDKQEYWWTYVCDRKSKTLLTSPYHITSLVDREECQLKFTAPIWKGTYTFAVCLRSDSYLGFHQQKDIKLDVKEAPKHVSESEDSEEEGPIEDNAHESDYTTDEDLPDDDD
ncbi:sec63 domain-containing [Holotrichia oblita]|uniref:Sec63 domain-containing n=1 Tax=Holotrichia oblita TaxID=644536 RepID=A0ACB9TDJ5_HOLOL|nr:sec63 domain-containing [Holotrichia oblita]